MAYTEFQDFILSEKYVQQVVDTSNLLNASTARKGLYLVLQDVGGKPKLYYFDGVGFNPISGSLLESPVQDEIVIANSDGTISSSGTTIGTIMSAITSSSSSLKGNVTDDGNTLEKLRYLITQLQTIVASDDINLDTVKELVTYIKDEHTLIDSITTSKVSKEDIIDDLIHEDIDKPLSARQGKILKDTIDTLPTGGGGTLDPDAVVPGDQIEQNESNRLVTDVQIADWNSKATGTHTHSKTSLGFSDVDNTSDLNKPVSTATSTAISAASTSLLGGVDADGNTLSKLRTLISGLQTLVGSNDVNLDTLQEIVTYIKANKTILDGVTTSKVNVSDVINVLTSTETTKPLSAYQGKLLNDSIALKVSTSSIVNNLTSTSTTVPLSAAQGKALSDLLAGKSSTTHNHAGVYHPVGGDLDLSGTQGSGVKLKDESTGTVWQVHMHGDRIRIWNGATELVIPINTDVPSHNHDASYSPTTHNHNTLYPAITHNHDASYVSYKGRSLSVADMNNPNYPTPYVASWSNGAEIGLVVNNSATGGMSSTWFHLQYFSHLDRNGYGFQIATSLDSNPARVYHRGSLGTGWLPWKRILNEDDRCGLGMDLGTITVSDANNVLTTGFAYCSGGNCPNGRDGLLLTMSHGSAWKQQEYWEFGGIMNSDKYKRTMGNGTWGAWERELKQSDYNTLFQYANDGKTGIANAIVAAGVSAAASETFASLAGKIGNIKKYAYYVLSSPYGPTAFGEIGGLPFLPNFVVGHWYCNNSATSRYKYTFMFKTIDNTDPLGGASRDLYYTRRDTVTISTGAITATTYPTTINCSAQYQWGNNNIRLNGILLTSANHTYGYSSVYYYAYKFD